VHHPPSVPCPSKVGSTFFPKSTPSLPRTIWCFLSALLILVKYVVHGIYLRVELRRSWCGYLFLPNTFYLKLSDVSSCAGEELTLRRTARKRRRAFGLSMMFPVQSRRDTAACFVLLHLHPSCLPTYLPTCASPGFRSPNPGAHVIPPETESGVRTGLCYTGEGRHTHLLDPLTTSTSCVKSKVSEGQGRANVHRERPAHIPYPNVPNVPKTNKPIGASRGATPRAPPSVPVGLVSQQTNVSLRDDHPLPFYTRTVYRQGRASACPVTAPPFYTGYPNKDIHEQKTLHMGPPVLYTYTYTHIC
jgi:hypothetical protein